MIQIIDYNMGNINSVINAFRYLGEDVSVAEKADDLEHADKIILPGVGAFGKGIENLKKKGFFDILNSKVIDQKTPFLGICLGMQLICHESSEFGNHKGFGWINAKVEKFNADMNLRIPHVGWNNLTIKKKNKLIESTEDVYFVHSFFVADIQSEFVSATCTYGVEFAAAFEQSNIFAVQFHPEKSQQPGLDILKRFASL